MHTTSVTLQRCRFSPSFKLFGTCQLVSPRFSRPPFGRFIFDIMKCYYDVLSVARDADSNEIKTAYRKLALKWHPDKNLENAEEAKEQFQFVQNAYEVLSDPQERAWYDNHREQLLKGAGTSFNDESLDLIPFFVASCFKGFGDDSKGFYEVYREVFKKLAAEEVDYLEDPEEVVKIPLFGKSDTEYEKVNEFYTYWLSFSTQKSYVWLDKYDIREADNRKVLKLLEKENQKIRQKARKERNEEIRQLVAFIRKRDRRVLAHLKAMEEKAKENKKKSENLRKEKVIKRQQELEEEKKKLKDVGVYNMDNLNERLEEIEKHLAEEFGISDDDYSSYASDDDAEITNVDEDKLDDEFFAQLKNLYCSACNKSFKNIKSFENHEKSKKHKENVINLQQSDLDVSNEEKSDSELSVKINEDIINSDDDNNSCHSVELPIATPKSKKKKNKKPNIIPVLNDSDSELENKDILEIEVTGRKARRAKNIANSKNKNSKKDVEISNDNSTVPSKNALLSEVEDISGDNNQNSSNINQEKNINGGNVLIEENDVSNEKVPNKQKKVKKVSQKKQVEMLLANAADLADLDTSHCCAVCKHDFPSKNKLFDHLKKTGHQIFIPNVTHIPSKSKKKREIRPKERT